MYSIQQDWFIFVLIFFVAFAMTYLAISKFFSNKEGLTAEHIYGGKRRKTIVANQGFLVLISVCIGLLVSIGMTQNPWLVEYLGDWASIMMSVFIGILFVILLVPFYRALESVVGRIVSTEVLVLFLWFALKYFSDSDIIYQIPYAAQNVLSGLGGVGVLVVALIVGFIFAKFAPKKKK